jgi:rhomboid family GlyGly-CTERM serine protease
MERPGLFMDSCNQDKARPAMAAPAVSAPEPFRWFRRGRTGGDQAVFPWIFLGSVVAAVAIQIAGAFTPAWSAALIFDRSAIAGGQWWRLWTGHLVHFGWPHCAVDTAVLLYLGWVVAWPRVAFRRLTFFLIPLLISGMIYLFDPEVAYYAGLSAFNLGLFVFHVLQSWHRNRTDWLWPAVLLVCVAEIAIESLRGGAGGGLIAFSDPTVRIATTAHAAGGVCGVALWALCRRYPWKKCPAVNYP